LVIIVATKDLTDKEWRERLAPDQYRVLRKAATEPPFTGIYVHTEEPGNYLCAGCGQKLFAAETKFDSGTGWPSFYAPASGEAVEEHQDNGWLGVRTEVRCAGCGGHLGHVFEDGPEPTGLRYCMNSCALTFVEAKPSSG
jgi:peptide-methionine (R)-S-oxide reductase